MRRFFKILFFIFAVSVAIEAEAHSSPAVNVKVTSFSIFHSPFSIKSGGLIRDYSYSSNAWVENKLRYNGKELLGEFDLGWYDYGSRYYNPMLGLFTTVDPQAYRGYGWGTYAYGLDNPLKYTDPNGEWVHLVIGAAIGGIMNWATNGAQFNAKGLGYFGVGAVAGAVGAGVGAGVSSAMAGGSFGAGFVGSSAAMTASSSFFSGAAIGSAGGASGGFLTGFGNSLVQEKGLSAALGSGAIGGLMGGVGGGIVGGVWSGIDAAIDGREFWNGATMINEQTIANQNLPLIRQQGDYNCAPAVGESTTGVSQDTYRGIIGGDPNKDPVTIAELNDAIRSETCRTARAISRNLPSDRLGAIGIANRMNSGSNFYLGSINAGESIGHATALNSITIRTFQKVSGDLYYKVIYQVMDPARGAYRIIGANSMKVVIWIRP